MTNPTPDPNTTDEPPMRVRLIYGDEIMADVTDVSEPDRFALYQMLARMSEQVMAQVIQDHEEVHDAATRQDFTRMMNALEHTDTCHDCTHPVTSHNIPDPNGELNYGIGSCGNCVECNPTGSDA